MSLSLVIFTEISDLLGILVILSALYMQSQTFVYPTIRAISVQSFIITALFVILFLQSGDLMQLYLAGITALIRGILIPMVMLYQVRRFKHSLRETGAGQRIPSFVVLGVIIVIGGYALFKSVLLPVLPTPLVSVPFALLLLGFLLIVTRGNALMQMTGFLEEENAVLYAGALIVPSIPLLIEFAVVLDILGVVLVGILLSATRDVLRTLESPDLEQLTG
jgi:Hydrogenase 4 membrane component (E)